MFISHVCLHIICQHSIRTSSLPDLPPSNTSMGVAATATATASPMGGRLQLFGPKGTRARPGVKCPEFVKLVLQKCGILF